MKISRVEFLKQLSAFAAEQRQMIEAMVSGFSTDPKASEKRRKNAIADFHFFATTYFPHYIKKEGGESIFHKFVYKELPALIDEAKGNKEAIAAPRGEAKSTIITQVFCIWCVVTGRKRYPVIIMDAFEQAAEMLEAIKVELEVNPRLIQDFPTATGQGRVWQAGVIVTANDCKVKAAGSGKRLRGMRHGPYRPDLIVLDDIENDENVRSKTQRDKLESWLKKAVLKLGPPDGSMDLIYIGTILHYDSVLNRTMKSPTWKEHLFKAIIKWPNRMDLWEKWEEVLINESEEAADIFYQRRKRFMDEGAVVSWPDTRPLLLLMKIRADDHNAFDSEYQNDPTSDEHAPFKHLVFWVHESNRWIFYGACDPSLGKKNKSRDPSAILVGGFDRKKGILDVVEANIARRVPDLIIENIIEYQRQYQCMVWVIEAVQFQEFLYTELVKRSAAKGIPVPARAVTPHTDKDLRIESLQPHTHNGLIRLHRSQTTLFEQLRHWPEADHDDGPDCLHMLWMAAVIGAGGIPLFGSRNTSKTNMRGYAHAG
ncbi:MAG: phage terminase large subunit [Arenicellales bacterium]